MTPNDPRTEVSTCKSSGTQPENSEACIARIQALTMKEMTSKAHMQVHTNKESCKKQLGRKMGPNRHRKGLGRPTCSDRPRGFLARFATPFALGVRLFIASADAGRHIEQIILPTSFTRKPPSQDECCGDSRSYRVQTMKEDQSSRTKTRTRNKRIAKSSLLNSRFLKRRSPLQVSFVSFYREVDGLFTFREHPRVKWIESRIC
jgi:hypothetical protein